MTWPLPLSPPQRESLSERLMEARQLEQHLKLNLDQALSRSVDLEVEAKSRFEVANSLSEECCGLRQQLAAVEEMHREAEAAREEEKAGRDKTEADLDHLAAQYSSLLAEVDRAVRGQGLGGGAGVVLRPD